MYHFDICCNVLFNLCLFDTNIFVLLYEVNEKNILLQSNIEKWTDSQMLLDHSAFTRFMHTYISQFIPNLEDDIIRQSINNVGIHFH